MAGITIRPFIFVRSDIEVDDVLEHEMIHIKQQESRLVFFLRYIFSPKWRVKYEAEAYAIDIIRGRETLESAINSIYSGLYLWPTTRENVRKQLLLYASRVE